MAEETEGTDSSIDLERIQTKILEIIFQKLQQMPGGEVLRMAYIEGKITPEIASGIEEYAYQE